MLNDVKINNIKQILLSLITRGNSTKLNLAADTGLSNTTLSDCINNLERLDIVSVVGVEDSIGGRRPSIYAANPEYGNFIGIIADQDGVRFGVTDFLGKLISEYAPLTNVDQPIITLVYEAIETALNDFSGKKMLGIGVAMDGVMDAKKGIVIKNSALRWNNVHLKELVERKYLISTYLSHKADAGVAYERTAFKFHNVENMACLYPFETDKLGVIVDNRPVYGANNRFGLLGDYELSKENIKLIKKFFSAEFMVVGYPALPPFDLSTDMESDGIIMRQSGDTYFISAAAVIAQTQWFGSIYFML